MTAIEWLLITLAIFNLFYFKLLQDYFKFRSEVCLGAVFGNYIGATLALVLFY